MDYTWPSVYVAYLFFFFLMGGALYFFFRSLHQGYFGPNAEEPKYRMLHDEEVPDGK